MSTYKRVVSQPLFGVLRKYILVLKRGVIFKYTTGNTQKLDYYDRSKAGDLPSIG